MLCIQNPVTKHLIFGMKKSVRGANPVKNVCFFSTSAALSTCRMFSFKHSNSSALKLEYVEAIKLFYCSMQHLCGKEELTYEMQTNTYLIGRQMADIEYQVRNIDYPFCEM